MADRLLFSKTGRAKYISHLDLMRMFQRAFARAKIPIKHTEGFHPHPFVSIALPLSVGYSSECEILEFGLLEGTDPPERVLRRFRRAVGMAAALWSFAVALLLGFGEVLGDTLIDQVSGPGGVLAGLLLAVGLPAACGLLGNSLADHWIRPPQE